MTIDEAQDKFKKLQKGTLGEKKIFKQILALLTELQHKNLSQEDLSVVEKYLETHLSEIQPREQAKNGFLKLKKMLMNELSFVPANHFTALGIGVGLAIGTGLGISFGVPFSMPMGLVYGLVMGATIGLVGGLLVGRYLDKKAEDENRVLTTL